ncbi:DHHC palmitoyltransferase-domain-containing protein [Boeremia exigua]|uniref:DHHC palmitoyltransferase-domain-containing protein n=1 Tax=Boeremia exigua TaxID=749465 RepID=UPI001E8DA4A0|nr:DHHC palmitoyltransferase-domain-containing protein [Boeremia exigua]KAH6625308.1 DHHC palmitoyltransferase-domain-containing protein [Boeremia exigua]
MATLGSPSPPSSPSRAMRPRAWARKVERYCCNTITYFPLLFVYGLTSWAAWVEVGIGLVPAKNAWTGHFTSALGFALYCLLNWSYTAAVFTDPGSPLSLRNGYSNLPQQEGGAMQYTSFTVKASDGGVRFCNKCQTHKPDRAHHCSTCKRCVLKMDHHCPWLATCVGLRNYKAFLLFLVYLTLFCWVCFAVSATWVWSEILSDNTYTDSLMPINDVLLAVLSGIIGIVITGFTSWHLWLVFRGQTTIESLEKTRYLSPLRHAMKHSLNDRNYVDAQANGRLSIGDQLREIHANALPGVTRPEEGETPARSPAPSNAQGNGYSHPAHNSYEYRERQQNQDRYDNYLDERDNEQLPNAFDLGWRRNIAHVFGPSPIKWFIPLVSTTGDGWSWEPSSKWIAARDRIRDDREREEQQQKQRERAAGWGLDTPTEAEFRRVGRVAQGWQPGGYKQPPSPRVSYRHADQPQYLSTTPHRDGRRSPNKADQILGREQGMYADGDVPLQPLPAKKKFDEYNYISDDDDALPSSYEDSSDELPADRRITTQTRALPATKNWNDLPEGFLDAPKKRRKSASRERTPRGRKDN